jgi:integrase
MPVRQRNTSWQADVQHDGKRYRERFSTEAAALAWEKAAKAALVVGKPLPPAEERAASQSTIEALLQNIITNDWGRKRGTGASIIHAKKFVAFVGPALSPKDALTQVNVDEFFADLIETRQPSGGTVNRYCSAVGKLSKKAYALGLIDRKPELPYEKEGEARLRWFTDDEEAMIVRTLLSWGKDRHVDWFTVLVDTGARTWAEMGRLKWRDVSGTARNHKDDRPRMVTFWDTKNGDSRSIPLTARAWDAIQRQRALREDGPFTGIDKADALRLLGRLRLQFPELADAVWYTARHTFASRLVQRGVPLYTVQKLMGHRTVEMTMRYAKLAPQNLIDAMGVLEPSHGALPVLPDSGRGGAVLPGIDRPRLALVDPVAVPPRSGGAGGDASAPHGVGELDPEVLALARRLSWRRCGLWTG